MRHARNWRSGQHRENRFSNTTGFSCGAFEVGMFSFKRNFKVKWSDTDRSSLPRFKFVLRVTFEAKQMQMATLINRIKRWETVARTASHVLIDRVPPGCGSDIAYVKMPLGSTRFFGLLKTIE